MNFEYLKNFMDRLTSWIIPGNSVSVCLDGKEVFNYQSGYSNLEEKIPMEKNALFNIYSCSKVATVTAALKLYEQGYFLLDDPLYDIFPEYRTMYIKGAEGSLKEARNPITIRNLFTMTSGMNYEDELDAIDEAKKITGGKVDTLSFVRCMAKEPLCFEPGTSWKYSYSHDILAGVVEAVSGMKFRDYVKRNIFEPLEMNDSYYHGNEKIYEKMAEQYSYEVEEKDIVKLQTQGAGQKNGKVVNVGKENTLVFGEEFDSGGAGIITSVEDYSKFAAALACRGVANNGERILSEGTIELLRTNQLSDGGLITDYGFPYLKGYGYGLGVRTLVDKAKSGSIGNVGEFGWGGAAGATILVDPKTGLSVFYAHHMLNPQEEYYQPRLRNVAYACI